MYVSTDKGFGQETMFYGTFAGTLGTNSYPVGIQKLLDLVRKRPQDYRKLLLTIIFDPLPGYSSRMALTEALKPLRLSNTEAVDAAGALLSFSRLGQIVRELEPVRLDLQKRDVGFQRLIDAELKLRYEMMKTAGGIRPQKAYEPFLLEASLLGPMKDLSLYKLGLDFAQKRFPAKLTQQIMSSSVSVGHLTYLGKFLQRYAEVLQSRDPAFKQRVEQEKKKRP